MQWLSENRGTILVALALLCMVAAIVRRLIRDRSQGRSACGCGCAGCPMRGACHKSLAGQEDTQEGVAGEEVKPRSSELSCTGLEKPPAAVSVSGDALRGGPAE